MGWKRSDAAMLRGRRDAPRPCRQLALRPHPQLPDLTGEGLASELSRITVEMFRKASHEEAHAHSRCAQVGCLGGIGREILAFPGVALELEEQHSTGLEDELTPVIAHREVASDGPVVPDPRAQRIC
jgi:hypothetical protein